MLLSRHCYASMRIHTHAHDATTKSPLRPFKSPSGPPIPTAAQRPAVGPQRGLSGPCNALQQNPCWQSYRLYIASVRRTKRLTLSLSLSLSRPTMAEILSVNTYYLSFPTDAYDSDVVAVQLKSYKQKDAYFTVAVFKDYVTAREFVLEFPTIPGSRLRIIDCFHNVLLITNPVFPIDSKHRTGTTDWWLDQSREIKECVGISEPLLPKFSLRNMAKRMLNSFVAA